LVLTDRAQTRGRPLVEVVRAAVEGGARGVVVREKDLPHRRRLALVSRLRPLVELLLLGVPPGPRVPSGLVDGVHLAAGAPVPAAHGGLVGRSCHDPGEVRRAGTEGCDYLTVSPVFETPSKPGYGPALGPDGLARLVREARVPVYALGGVTPELAAACVEAGAHGVAVMGAVMRAADPAATVAELVRALEATGEGVRGR
jgi:thiamine monophosphate synthase